MNRSLTLALAVLAAPCSSAFAGDVVVRVTGTVDTVSPGPNSGPFVGTAVGDVAVLEVEVFVPGAVAIPGQFERYTVDPTGSTFTLGVTTVGVGASLLDVIDAFPVADRLQLGGATLGNGGGTITCEMSNSAGTMFSSTDLLQNLGVWPQPTFSSTNYLVTGNGGFISITVNELRIELAAISTNYCSPIEPNSTGVTGEMFAVGSVSVAANDVTLGARHLPLNSFGFFLVSRSMGYTPTISGNAAFLCLSGNIGRYVGPGQVKSSGMAGEFTLRIDLGSVPQNPASVAAVAGDTWHFQAWHRDVRQGQASWNFTDGIALTFQ